MFHGSLEVHQGSEQEKWHRNGSRNKAKWPSLNNQTLLRNGRYDQSLHRLMIFLSDNERQKWQALYNDFFNQQNTLEGNKFIPIAPPHELGLEIVLIYSSRGRLCIIISQ